MKKNVHYLNLVEITSIITDFYTETPKILDEINKNQTIKLLKILYNGHHSVTIQQRANGFRC